MTRGDRTGSIPRRRFVALSVGLAGCLGGDEGTTGTDTPPPGTPSRTQSAEPSGPPPTTTQPSPTTQSPTEYSEVLILISNGHDEERRFDIRIADGERAVFETNVTVPPDSSTVVGSIERGRYGVSVSVPGVGEESGYWVIANNEYSLEIDLDGTDIHIETPHADPTTSG